MSASWGERAKLGALLVLTVATIVTIALVFSRTPGPTTPSAAPEDFATTAAETALSVPERAKVLFIGDDWTAGLDATSEEMAFPALVSKQMGWTYQLDAIPGSGWAHSSPAVPGSIFIDRVFRMLPEAFVPDLVVISAQMISPAPTRDIRKLMRHTVSTLRDRLPQAVVAVVLPYGNPHGLDWCSPVASEDVLCVDTYGERWITDGNRTPYFTGRDLVPNNAGHAYFARRLVDDLRRDLTVG